eukprot:CAMPEP_0168314426 /NCGR_PEP_ID=MMETSP0210-20121227/8133_1 /TAXON_ID=40633 /ORGANISM="Condylostoma magnum, Strain COL2" /LENGTH=188 /DNA_ID=CAMNT_0008282379 /DNA_START=165 /DNA_END=731 /DNA_ORIENTATION=-
MEADIVLIDGFPRSAEQAIYLEHLGVNIDYILHFDTDREDVLLERLIERGRTSGRADDNEETIFKRFFVYKAESVPVLALYEPFGYVKKSGLSGWDSPGASKNNEGFKSRVVLCYWVKVQWENIPEKKYEQLMRYKVIDLEELKVKVVEGRKVVMDDDAEIVNAVVYKLLHLKSEYRILLENFPENEA